jgi:hypothetical protein
LINQATCLPMPSPALRLCSFEANWGDQRGEVVTDSVKSSFNDL